MKDMTPMAAEMLEASSAGFASAALAELTRRSPALRGETSRPWRQHLESRTLDLAAAIRTGNPFVFSKNVEWARQAALARGQDDSTIRLALESLADALRRELPEQLLQSVLPTLERALEDAKRPVEPAPPALSDNTALGRLGLEYIAACLDPARNAAELITDEADGGTPLRAIYCDVLVPVQRTVGQLWHAGDLSVAEERIVSETTRRVMSLLVARLPPPAADAPLLVAASVAGNAHDIGLRIAADLFSLAGWRCIYLGANVPDDEIGGSTSEYVADLLLLTATLPTQLKALERTIAVTKSQAPAIRVLVGGRAFDDSPDLWERVGADGFAATIESAPAIGLRLIGRSTEADS